jgi:hypothetical protein
MSGAIPLPPPLQYVFMSFTGTTLPSAGGRITTFGDFVVSSRDCPVTRSHIAEALYRRDNFKTRILCTCVVICVCVCGVLCVRVWCFVCAFVVFCVCVC